VTKVVWFLYPFTSSCKWNKASV